MPRTHHLPLISWFEDVTWSFYYACTTSRSFTFSTHTHTRQVQEDNLVHSCRSGSSSWFTCPCCKSLQSDRAKSTFAEKIKTHQVLCCITNWVHVTSVKVQFGHLQSVGLALFLAEAENDDRLEVPLHDHLHDLEHTGWTWRKITKSDVYLINYSLFLRILNLKADTTHTHTFSASFASSWVPLATSAAAPRIPCVSQHLHSCVEIVLSEVSLRKTRDIQVLEETCHIQTGPRGCIKKVWIQLIDHLFSSSHNSL